MSVAATPCFSHALPLGQPARLAAAVAAALGLMALGGPAQAADAPGGSRIERVTLYPGQAQVERVARVAAGARELVLDCLSTSFDMASLQVETSEGVRLGPVSAVNRARAEVPACDASPLDARIRSLEERMAALQAEGGGHDLVLGYLRGLGGASGGPGAEAGRTAPTGAAGLQAWLGGIQRAGQEALSQQNRITREREALERELQPLRTERDRQRGPGAQVRQLRIALAASKEGSLRLRYLVNGPSWAPAYRATLASEGAGGTGASVLVERLAQVSQRSGEDWQDVKLVLSTGAPGRATEGPQPQPWEVFPRPAVEARSRRALSAPAAAMAMAPAPMPTPMLADAAAEPDFTVRQVEGEYATEFEVPGTVGVESAGQRVSLALGSQSLAAQVRVQSVPRQSPSAWVVAEVARPQGVWPEGPMQLWRGSQSVGQTTWRNGERDTLSLPFGRDELVRVRSLPTQQHTASSGFIGTRQERRESHAYEVENRHRSAIELVVLESGPVARDAQIQVSSQYTPAPQPGGWQDLPGVVAWRQTLGAGQKARFAAEHLISHPTDAPVMENR